jgi:hypothetical protein
MALELTGGLDAGGAGGKLDRGECGELLRGDGTDAEDDEGAIADGDDGGLDAEGAWAAIEDEGDAAIELLKDVGGSGGGDAAEAIGAGGGDGLAEALKHGAKKRMGAHADGDGGEAGGDDVRDERATREDEGERAGPKIADERLDEGIGGGGGEPVEPIEGGKMDDERIEEGAFLCLEDAGDGLRIEGVAGEAVNGLSGKGDDLAGGEERRGGGDAGAAIEDVGGHEGKLEVRSEK